MSTIRRIKQISGTSEAVWALLRDFSGTHRWYPGEGGPELTLIGNPEIPGAQRMVGEGTDFHIVEELTELDDENLRISYTLKTSPFPLSNHLASLHVTADGPDQCIVTWVATFDAAPDVVVQMEELMGGAFTIGLDGLASKFTDHSK